MLRTIDGAMLYDRARRILAKVVVTFPVSRRPNRAWLESAAAIVAAEISAASSREIAYVPVPHDAFVIEMAKSGAPKDVVWLLDYLFSTVLDGRNAYLTDGVRRALAERFFRLCTCDCGDRRMEGSCLTPLPFQRSLPMTNNDKTMSVLSSYGTRGLLLASGLIAAGITAMILFAPNVFYGGYGIEIGANVSLVNELKAPAGLLLLAGLLMLAGVFRQEFAIPALQFDPNNTKRSLQSAILRCVTHHLPASRTPQ
jgi:hypothetical protein